MNPLDYGRSFIIGNGPANEVRFWVESRTRLIDVRTGTYEDYLQCGSCKSENTFAGKEKRKTSHVIFEATWKIRKHQKRWHGWRRRYTTHLTMSRGKKSSISEKGRNLVGRPAATHRTPASGTNLA